MQEDFCPFDPGIWSHCSMVRLEIPEMQVYGFLKFLKYDGACLYEKSMDDKINACMNVTGAKGKWETPEIV